MPQRTKRAVGGAGEDDPLRPRRLHEGRWERRAVAEKEKHDRLPDLRPRRDNAAQEGEHVVRRDDRDGDGDGADRRLPHQGGDAALHQLRPPHGLRPEVERVPGCDVGGQLPRQLRGACLGEGRDGDACLLAEVMRDAAEGAGEGDDPQAARGGDGGRGSR